MRHVGTYGERRATVYRDYWLAGVTHAMGWTFTLDDKPAHNWTGDGPDMWEDEAEAKAAAERAAGHAMTWEATSPPAGGGCG